MSREPMGLRESKKQETRQLISDHATRLFIENGFESTTIAEIAAAARVAKKTVTNYFARKEDLAFDHQDEFVQGLARTVAGRSEGESALAALRREFLAAVGLHDPVIGFSGEVFARMIADSPTLVARLRDLHDQREEALAVLLATETGAAADDIVPRAAAAQLGAAHRVLFQRIQELTLDGRSDERIAETVTVSAHRVFGLLEGSLGDYAVK
ncbi:TetR family transcriptional regulator [Streptomyces agglomeratus]|uniref:TetR/AcrR family transcriptional regulator n=1 Tax=Streptomyces agglomeratus TaxID=285458 RepID=UPI0008548EE9|nr:TetR/AcrR family transcriptional regulator [Streptomyces agglomeratus]OEJ43267.1 TetR family transcriptional regulator [Streptomyces agglomeratus]OEJ54813.1 TetR family transcriptional regulator [Streptomyces agglomeratus]OEJ62186.1 TetR family transcriptional regulator [Streptomyces agglomeratus]